MTANPTNSAFCPAFRDALQAYLDAAIDALPAECEAHRSACASCRAEFIGAVALRSHFRGRREISSPVGLTDRLVATVLAEAPKIDRARRTARQALSALAVAACLLLAAAVGSRMWKPEPSAPISPAPAPDTVALDQKPTRISIDDNLANAGDALVSLARRSANQTMEPAKLIPDNPRFGLTDPLPDAMEPAAQSLAEIRQGASSGFEPLGRTARRAFNLFLRDMPVQADNKPGS